MRKDLNRARNLSAAAKFVSRRPKPPRPYDVHGDKGFGGETEAYQCTGIFKEDFPKVCHDYRVSYVPAVVVRSVQAQRVGSEKAVIRKSVKRPVPRNVARNQEHASHAIRPSVSSHQILRPKEDVPVVEGASQALENQPEYSTDEPVTYMTTERLAYFMPCIQVYQDIPEDDTTVSEMSIRGWKVDVTTMEVLGQCLPALSCLRMLQLWRTGLEPEVMRALACFLPQCPQLGTLVLDGNVLTGADLSSLLSPGNCLKHLSLRFCGLTDADTRRLGPALGSAAFSAVATAATAAPAGIPAGHDPVTAASLVSLNLSNNRIGDEGASWLAEGLKVNRTLLVLNLASNRIGDAGAARLAIALSQFPANSQELKERRRLIRGEDRSSNKTHRKYRSFYEIAKAVSLTSLSGTKLKDRDKDKDKEKDKDKDKVAGYGKKEPLAVKKMAKDQQQRDKARSPKPAKRKKEAPSSQRTLAEEKDDDREEPEDRDRDRDRHSHNPLADYGRLRDGQLWLPANRTLLSLNLSRNAIGERGFAALLAAVEDQTQPLHGCQWQTPGLGRLELHHNPAPDTCASAKEIRRYLRPRDPTLRVPRVDLRRANITPCSVPFAWI